MKPVTDMKTQHTPGPWKHDGAGYGNIRPAKETGRNICTFTRQFSIEEYEQVKADARLIAAAPELLALIADSAFQLERLTGSNLETYARTFAALARAAISKATGN